MSSSFFYVAQRPFESAYHPLIFFVILIFKTSLFLIVLKDDPNDPRLLKEKACQKTHPITRRLRVEGNF